MQTKTTSVKATRALQQADNNNSACEICDQQQTSDKTKQNQGRGTKTGKYCPNDRHRLAYIFLSTTSFNIQNI